MNGSIGADFKQRANSPERIANQKANANAINRRERIRILTGMLVKAQQMGCTGDVAAITDLRKAVEAGGYDEQ